MSENISDDEIDEELNIENKQTEINFNFDEIQPQDFILLNDTIPTATATLKCFDDHLKQFGEYSGNTINVDTTDCSFNSDIGSDSTIYELKLKLQSLLENDYETYENILQEWFDNQIDYQAYESRITKCLNEQTIPIHNQLILNILKSSFCIQKTPLVDQLNSFINKFFDIDFDNLSAINLIEQQRATKVNLLELKKEPNDNDDEEDTMIKRIKKKKRVKFNPFADDDDDDDDKSTKNKDDLKQSSDNEILNNNHDFVNVKKKRKVMRISSDDEDDVSYNTNINGTSNDTSDFNKPATISFTKSQSTSMLDQLLNSSAPISFLDREPKADNAPTNVSVMSNDTKTLSSFNKNDNVKTTLLRQCLSLTTSITTQTISLVTSRASSSSANVSVMNSNNTICMLNLQNNTSVIENNDNCKTKDACAQTNDVTGVDVSNDFDFDLTDNIPPANDFANLFSTAAPLIVEPTLITLESLLNAKDFQTEQKEILVSIKNHTTLPNNSATESTVNNDNDQVADNAPVEVLLSTETDITLSQTNNRQTEIHTNLSDLRNLFFRVKIDSNQLSSMNQEDNSTDNSNYFDRRNVYNFEKYDPIIDITGPTIKKHIEELMIEDNKDDDDNASQKSSDSVSTLKQLTPLEKINKLKTCFKEVSLPDNVLLGLRISEIASHHRITSVDDCVTYLCNAALKNLMRNILTAIITSRSSFQVRNNRIYHNIGNPSVNPYLRNSFREYQNYSTKNDISNQNKNSKSNNLLLNENQSIISLVNSIKQPSSYGSNLKPKKFGIDRNNLLFTTDDQINFPNGTFGKFRSFSGPLYIPDSSTSVDLNCNLRHLFNVLQTNHSLIPVHNVWSKALYRTISALNNVPNISNE